MVYNLEVNIKISYGCYQWCSSARSKEHSGYYLSGNGKDCSRMVRVSIILNDNLLKETDIIEIYDETGFLAQYTTSPLKSNMVNLFFQLKYVEFNTVLDVRCRKFDPCDLDKLGCRRRPMSTVHSVKVKIPEEIIKGSTTCSICLEDTTPTPNNKCLMECQHIFHIQCLWSYLKHNGYLNPVNCCTKYCDHIEKPRPFPCPICSTIL